MPVHQHTFSNASAFYSNSAPVSSVGINPSQTPRARPPVPLFPSNSTGNIHQQRATGVNTMADINVAGYEGLGADFDTGLGQLDSTVPLDFSWDDFGAANPTFTAINNTPAASTAPRTVSPKDIFMDSQASAPPSTAFTNLTSPSIDDSPYVPESYEPSPLFHGGEVNGGDNWFSLFPTDSNESSGEVLQRTVSDQSLEQTSSSSNSPLVLGAGSQRKSSADQSPGPLSLQRHSSVAGVKSRRRKGPLAPIAVDPSDKVALKRARNTLAARDSRQRKVDHVQNLERRIAELEALAQDWKTAALTLGYNGPLT